MRTGRCACAGSWRLPETVPIGSGSSLPGFPIHGSRFFLPRTWPEVCPAGTHARFVVHPVLRTNASAVDETCVPDYRVMNDEEVKLRFPRASGFRNPMLVAGAPLHEHEWISPSPRVGRFREHRCGRRSFRAPASGLPQRRTRRRIRSHRGTGGRPATPSGRLRYDRKHAVSLPSPNTDGHREYEPNRRRP